MIFFPLTLFNRIIVKYYQYKLRKSDIKSDCYYIFDKFKNQSYFSTKLIMFILPNKKCYYGSIEDNDLKITNIESINSTNQINSLKMINQALKKPLLLQNFHKNYHLKIDKQLQNDLENCLIIYEKDFLNKMIIQELRYIKIKTKGKI
jgi:hypothetical protein